MNGPPPNGRISSGIPADNAALKTLEFIQRNLAGWRDDPQRPNAESERDLNTQLCKYLNVAARNFDFAMVHFHHEEPQGSQHSADISASPIQEEWIEGRQYTKYDPVIVLESKRLPAPTTQREREYVAFTKDGKPKGGVQRFKMGLHGADHSIAGMVGYIQNGTCQEWFADLNQWIAELASSGESNWSSEDRLSKLVLDADSRVSRCESDHARTSGISARVHLEHLWVETAQLK